MPTKTKAAIEKDLKSAERDLVEARKELEEAKEKLASAHALPEEDYAVLDFSGMPPRTVKQAEYFISRVCERNKVTPGRLASFALAYIAINAKNSIVTSEVIHSLQQVCKCKLYK